MYEQPAIRALSAGDLRIAPRIEPGRLRLTWSGRSRARDPGGAILPYFRDMCALALDASVPIEMQFGALEYMNSSTITAIIEAIQVARAAGVRLVLVYDGASRWQRSSFDVLQVFADGAALELRAAA